MKNRKTYVRTVNRHYLENQIKHATQGEIILMLYDGAINFLNQFKKAIIDKNPNLKDDAFARIQAILQELQHGLNMEDGGEIAKNLSSLYAFMLKHLFEASLNSDDEAAESITDMIRELRDAWSQAHKEVKIESGNRVKGEYNSQKVSIQVG